MRVLADFCVCVAFCRRGWPLFCVLLARVEKEGSCFELHKVVTSEMPFLLALMICFPFTFSFYCGIIFAKVFPLSPLLCMPPPFSTIHLTHPQEGSAIRLPNQRRGEDHQPTKMIHFFFFLRPFPPSLAALYLYKTHTLPRPKITPASKPTI